MNDFQFYDYIIIVSPTGQKASNLRELLSALEEAEDNVLFYHLFQSHLKFQSELYDYNGDFANWALNSLGDFALAEKIGNFDPYDFLSVRAAKESLIEIIEEHMWDLPNIPWVRPGFEFYFSYATSVIIPSGIIVSSLVELRDALHIINNNSFYFHFCESRKIHKDKKHDDLSLWIYKNFKNKNLVKKIHDIDFYFFSLEENKKKLISILNEEIIK